jgi:hypothetical protein
LHWQTPELSIENEQNCRLLFFGNVPSSAAVDFAFRDAAARAGFCELLQTINANIVCQDAAPAPVLPAHPEWVDDADAPCCMRCGVGFSLLQRSM